MVDDIVKLAGLLNNNIGLEEATIVQLNASIRSMLMQHTAQVVAMAGVTKQMQEFVGSAAFTEWTEGAQPADANKGGG